MMQLVHRVSLVVMLLLASVGTASAECAWVAWRQAVGSESVGKGRPHEYLEPWAILDTAPTQAQCQALLKSDVLRQAFPGPNNDKEIKDATQGREGMAVFLLSKEHKIMASQEGANIVSGVCELTDRR